MESLDNLIVAFTRKRSSGRQLQYSCGIQSAVIGIVCCSLYKEYGSHIWRPRRSSNAAAGAQTEWQWTILEIYTGGEGTLERRAEKCKVSLWPSQQLSEQMLEFVSMCVRCSSHILDCLLLNGVKGVQSVKCSCEGCVGLYAHCDDFYVILVPPEFFFSFVIG